VKEGAEKLLEIAINKLGDYTHNIMN